MKKQSWPLCEKCCARPATSFSYFGHRGGSKDQGQQWFFTCMCTASTETYYVTFDSFFLSPAETVDWLAHLDSKGWMNWPDFIAMLRRFRDAPKFNPDNLSTSP